MTKHLYRNDTASLILVQSIFLQVTIWYGLSTHCKYEFSDAIKINVPFHSLTFT
jgi:hypothetical protein